MTAPRVLGVFVDRPWPGVTGDMQRVRALVDAIQPVSDLSIFLAPRGTGAGRPPVELRVVEVARTRGRGRAAARFVAGIPRARPPMMAFYRQPAVRRALARVLAELQPDVVLTHHLGGAALVDGLVNPAKVILDLPNNEVQRFGRMVGVAQGLQKARFRAERALTKRWVQRHMPSYRAVLVVSSEDEAAYRALAPSARLMTVANGTSPPVDPRADPGGCEILFLGDLEYAPNREGLTWFVEHVLPNSAAVSALRVAGRGPAPVAERVDALGFVDDLEAELDRVVAMVVPIRAGGGTRLKVLEAFGHGVPVISTELGVEGLGAQPGVHYLAAESPTQWVDALEAVIRDESLRQRLSAAGRALVDANFTWPDVTAPLVELMRP